MVVTDFNHDGNLDVMAVGNSFSSETGSGFYDAGIGVILKGDGKGSFSSVPVNTSGFFVDSDAKGFAELTLGNTKKIWIVTSNNDSLKVFRQPDFNQQSTLPIKWDDMYAEIIFDDGRKQKQEFYFGSGYLSQSSRLFTIPKAATQVYIFNRQGIKRKVF
jgi:enediyne biosynthesis protein E4